MKNATLCSLSWLRRRISKGILTLPTNLQFIPDKTIETNKMQNIWKCFIFRKYRGLFCYGVHNDIFLGKLLFFHFEIGFTPEKYSDRDTCTFKKIGFVLESNLHQRNLSFFTSIWIVRMWGNKFHSQIPRTVTSSTVKKLKLKLNRAKNIHLFFKFQLYLQILKLNKLVNKNVTVFCLFNFCPSYLM